MFTGPPLLLLLLSAQPAAPAPPAPFTAARFREHVAYLASDEMAGRDVGSAGSARATEYIVRHLKECGAKGLLPGGEFYQEFPFTAGGRHPVTARNVLAVVHGKGELAREAVLVSAHHDHLGTDPKRIAAGKDGIFNGADDNASGCAALLLIAEALHADRGRLPASCRTVVFATFDAEERGLVGSRYYVNHPAWPLERTAADLNFDMVGRLQGRRVLAADAGSNPFLAGRIAALAPACGLRVETRLSGVRRADNASFLDREIPGVHFSSGLHPDYHQVSDEVGKIDAAGGARIAWMVYRLLREAVEVPGPLRYRRPPPATDVQSVLQLVVRLGILPEQNAQGGRYPLVKFVMPGSPAARNGMQSGDEILGLNGGRFEGLEDAAVAFGQVRLDRPLRLAVRRKGKEAEVTIPPEVFRDMAGPRVRPAGKGAFEVVFRFQPTGKVRSVALAGTFNKWDVKARPLEGPDAEGFWTTRLELPAGVYEYKFVLDGGKWVADPTNFRRTGEHGNSVLIVGDPP
jgi:hypothetical protein